MPSADVKNGSSGSRQVGGTDAQSDQLADSEGMRHSGSPFFGVDNRAIGILESSTGDNTPPTAPAGLNANVFGDGETWPSWGASTDNATPSALLVYEVYLNGAFDQAVGGGTTQAILYAEVGVLNTIEVIVVDGAGNRSAPATITVDLRQ
jgi:hypothetical protein